MKKIIQALIICVVFVTTSVAQQTVTIPLTNPQKEAKLKMYVLNGSITVKGYDGKEVIVTGNTRKNKYKDKNKNKNKYGLKRISDQTMEFSVEEFDNTVRVKTNYSNSIVDFEIKVPRKCSLKLSTTNNGFINVENVSGVMEISNINGSITLKDVSGSVSADALNDDIVVNFVKVSPNTPMAFSNLNGKIDVTFPKTIKADIKLKSDMGEIYTDFDIKSTPRKPKVTRNKSRDGKVYKVKVENWIQGTINGGGGELLFKTFNGDIIIRSK